MKSICINVYLIKKLISQLISELKKLISELNFTN